MYIDVTLIEEEVWTTRLHVINIVWLYLLFWFLIIWDRSWNWHVCIPKHAVLVPSMGRIQSYRCLIIAAVIVVWVGDHPTEMEWLIILILRLLRSLFVLYMVVLLLLVYSSLTYWISVIHCHYWSLRFTINHRVVVLTNNIYSYFTPFVRWNTLLDSMML